MDTLTIRVSRSTHALLQELAVASNVTMSQVVDEAARELREKRFWADYHASYAALRADPVAWADLQEDVAAWDSTLADGLENPSDEPIKRRKKPRPR
jgi:predicted transcriptional regulator